jgi:hypothetical protein
MNRPGGLTALAVFNFVVAFFYLLAGIGLLVAVANPEGRSGQLATTSETLIGIQAAYSLVDVALLIVAGIGYLKLKRVLGRWVGTIEAVLGLCFFGFTLGVTLHAGGAFRLSSLNYVVYPGITLVLLHIVFRENLVE